MQNVTLHRVTTRHLHLWVQHGEQHTELFVLNNREWAALSHHPFDEANPEFLTRVGAPSSPLRHLDCCDRLFWCTFGNVLVQVGCGCIIDVARNTGGGTAGGCRVARERTQQHRKKKAQSCVSCEVQGFAERAKSK